MDQRQNDVNSFLDSMDGQAGANPFADAQNAVAQEIAPAANQTPQQVSPAVRPTTAWPTEQAKMPMQQAPAQQPASMPQAAPIQAVPIAAPIQVPQPIPTQPIPVMQQTAPPQMAVIKSETTEIGGNQQPSDPFAAALSQAQAQSEQRLTEALAAKKPFFCYGKAKDEIDDADITFEALREKYEADFPELSDSKLVTWSVSYGKVTKQISMWLVTQAVIPYTSQKGA